MAQNLTSRVTLLDVSVKGKGSNQFVLRTKEAVNAFLYAMSVANWPQNSPMPNNRKAAIAQFFGMTGNTLNVQTVIMVTDTSAFRDAHAADSYVRKLRDQTGKQKSTGRQRTRN
jgi:hypothetical protein